MQIAVITGASSGIGLEFVKQIANQYKKLEEIWVISRKIEIFDELQKELSVRLRPISLDLTLEESWNQIKVLLQKDKPIIRLLVNSAGFGKIGQFTEIPYEDVIGMPELNCTALTAVTHLCIPYMRKGSRIIQLASSAAFLPQPGFAVYAATKSYVYSFSRALNMELKNRGITVTAVCPGPVKTDFFERAETVSKRPAYKKLFMADVDQVVKLALKDAAHKSDSSIYGVGMKLLKIVSKVLPCRWILFFMKFH